MDLSTEEETDSCDDNIVAETEKTDERDARGRTTRKKSTRRWDKYVKKFKSEWLEDPVLAEWIDKGDDETKAVCRFCKTYLRAHKSDLKKHMSSSKHKKSISQPKSVDTSLAVNIDKCHKEKLQHEICLAAYVGCHSKDDSISHLTRICNRFSDPRKKIDVNIPKCVFIIKNIIAPYLFNELLEDLKGARYSLIFDEFYDFSCNQYLCICIRYFSRQFHLIMSQFLGLICLDPTSGSSQYAQLKAFLNDHNLDLSFCLAVAIDGDSNLVNSKYSLFSLLKMDIPNLFVIKCIPHSLQLACSRSIAKLPNQIEYMIRETFNWFQRSAMMNHDHNDLYRIFGDKKGNLQPIHLAGNHWLVSGKSIKLILEQYHNLFLHFKKDIPYDKYLSEQLKCLYGDPENKLYLVFLNQILKEFDAVNVFFQEENLDFYKGLSALQTFVLKMLRRIILEEHITLNLNLATNSIYLPLDKIDFGCEFLILLTDLLEKQQMSVETALRIKENCLLFLKELCKQLQMRVSEEQNLFNKIANLSPSICLSHTRPPFSELPLELADKSQLEKIELEWKQLLYVDWSLHFDTIPIDGQTFWCVVSTTVTEDGHKAFQHLSEFALTICVLPINNSAIEKVFSQANILKTELDDQLDVDSLIAHLRMKSCFSGEQECCFNVEPSDAMVVTLSKLQTDKKFA